MKYKHQHSGRGLLLTISTSVGKYLYVGELIEKTHFMSRKTHSIDQGKMRHYVQGSNGPLDSLTCEGMQPTSKLTHHQSVATPSRQIKRVHEDPRAHQSYQTASRQAKTHIHNMGAHLAVSRPRIGPFGHLLWSTDLQGRPTIGRFASVSSSTWRSLNRCQRRCKEEPAQSCSRGGHGTPL